MKIIQISAVLENEAGNDATVYGLGDDQQMYYWNYKKGWVLWKIQISGE